MRPELVILLVMWTAVLGTIAGYRWGRRALLKIVLRELAKIAIDCDMKQHPLVCSRCSDLYVDLLMRRVRQ